MFKDLHRNTTFVGVPLQLSECLWYVRFRCSILVKWLRSSGSELYEYNSLKNRRGSSHNYLRFLSFNIWRMRTQTAQITIANLVRKIRQPSHMAMKRPNRIQEDRMRVFVLSLFRDHENAKKWPLHKYAYRHTCFSRDRPISERLLQTVCTEPMLM